MELGEQKRILYCKNPLRPSEGFLQAEVFFQHAGMHLDLGSLTSRAVQTYDGFILDDVKDEGAPLDELYLAGRPVLFLGASFVLQLKSFLRCRLGLVILDEDTSSEAHAAKGLHLLTPLSPLQGIFPAVAEGPLPYGLTEEKFEVRLSGEGELHPALQGRLLKAKVSYLMSLFDARPILWELPSPKLNLALAGQPANRTTREQLYRALAGAVQD